LSAARRVVAAVSLAAKEYALGTAPAGGRILLPDEVSEAKLFIEQAKFDVSALPVRVRAAAESTLTAFRALLDQRAPPDSVQRLADALSRRLAAAVGGALIPLPARPPSLARGAAVYRQQCAACHGETGHGDGPKARSLKGPPPANLADPAIMGAVTPEDIYRRVLIGVAGTAMPSFEDQLSPDDIWAVTAYVATLPYGGSASAAVFAAARRQLDSAVAARSDKLAFEAYLTFEQVETAVKARNPGLATALEADFAALRARAAAGALPEELRAIHQRLLAELERAERLVVDRPSGANLFGQSFFLLLREGFEAILIVGALMTFLTKAGAAERRREVAWGAWAALGASVLTAVAIELLFKVTPGQRETLEGATMLLAAAVLFYVSYWLLSKIEADKWGAFLKGRMRDALSSGSGLALASVAFLAVYREGFETILFYKALLSSGESAAAGGAGGGGGAAVLAGIALGAVALVGLYLAINRFGMRVAMKPFFAVTGALLYYMAFVFTGKGVAELQSAGVIGVTVVPWAPRIPFLGVYPTLESLALQALLLVLALFAVLRMVLKPSAVS
jgi:high-affinity iron transporter